MNSRFAFILPILVMIALSGCLKKKAIRGDEFVEREVLVNVLVDIHLADGIVNNRRFHNRYDADSIDLLTPILNKYDITREMFDTTMATYSRYPNLMDEVYNDVLVKLSVMLDENDQALEANKPAM
jgi:hypothetical protein